jgi:hypothetical protein
MEMVSHAIHVEVFTTYCRIVLGVFVNDWLQTESKSRPLSPYKFTRFAIPMHKQSSRRVLDSKFLNHRVT